MTEQRDLADILRSTGQRVIGAADLILQTTQPAPTTTDSALDALTLAEAIGREAELVKVDEASGSWAAAWDATLTSYHYGPLSDRVTVTVRGTHVLVDGSHGAATATAKVGLSIGLCSWPTPTPSPTPTPDPALPPVDADATARCGDLLVPITIPGGSTEPVLHISAATLKAKFTPALAK